MDRRALGVAGDDADGVTTVSALVDRIGYDAIPLGTLSAGRVLQPGGPVFGAVLRRGDFQRAVRGRAEEQKAFRLAEQHYERSA